MCCYFFQDIDGPVVTEFHGFRSLTDYYRASSALGDLSDRELATQNVHDVETPRTGKIHNVTIPLCVIHALDDPLITWKTVARNSGLMHPNNLTKTGEGNLLLLLTKGGGHVGWPVGIHKKEDTIIE